MDPSMFGMFVCVRNAHTSLKGHKPIRTLLLGCLFQPVCPTLSGSVHIGDQDGPGYYKCKCTPA